MISRLFDLSGKVALVTGSYRGLGLTLAKGLAKAGASVILNGRNRVVLDETVERLRSDGFKVSGNCFDITSGDEVREAVAEIESQTGGIDILVNNAGVQNRGSLETISLEAWQRVLDTNLTGAFLVSKEVIRGMITRKSGKIINICSLMSEFGRSTVGPYTAAKGGLKNLTKAMTADWAKHNIQVNGIGPGYFVTEMTQVLKDDAEFDSWLTERTPAGRWGEPKELVGTAIFLASSASDFVNGQIIYVDGGILATL